MDDPIRVHDCPCCNCSPDPAPIATRPPRPFRPHVSLTAAQYARAFDRALRQVRETIVRAQAVVNDDLSLPRLRQRRP